MLQYRHIISTGHWHNTQRHRTCEQHKRVDVLLLFTSPNARWRPTCDQHNKCGDASVQFVGTTNPHQIEVMGLSL